MVGNAGATQWLRHPDSAASGQSSPGLGCAAWINSATKAKGRQMLLHPHQPFTNSPRPSPGPSHPLGFVVLGIAGPLQAPRLTSIRPEQVLDRLVWIGQTRLTRVLDWTGWELAWSGLSWPY